ncbi:MAG: type II secretion system F family protein [Deltaproteobacteria bacterium]|nr:type II secretion system F family protein [Deltaproteobacteria bacterium]
MMASIGTVVVALLFCGALGVGVAVLVAWGADQQARQAARVRLQMTTSGAAWMAVLIGPLAVQLRPWLQRPWCDVYRQQLDQVFVGLGLRAWRSEHLVAGVGVLVVLFGSLFTVCTSLGARSILPALCCGVTLPGVWLRCAWLARCHSIERVLPMVMELLATAVAAGLDLTSATARVAEALPDSPLRRLLDQLRADLVVGVGQAAAWRGFAVRAAVPAVERFVALLAQAQRLGTPIAELLQAQAVALRTERFQHAERRGAVASQLLLLPTIICILPAYFCLVLGGLIAGFVTYGWEGMF